MFPQSLFPPSLFPPPLFPGPGKSAEVVPVVPSVVGPVRDWDVLEDVARRLIATRAFSRGDVHISDGPDFRGVKAEAHAVAIIVPGTGDESDGFDDPDEAQWVRRVTWTLKVMVKGKTPHARDREAERLGNVARTTLDFRCLAGVTLPALTKIVSDAYEMDDPPFRTLRLSGQFAYFIDGPDGHSTAR